MRWRVAEHAQHWLYEVAGAKQWPWIANAAALQFLSLLSKVSDGLVGETFAILSKLRTGLTCPPSGTWPCIASSRRAACATAS
mmetsp:Transcript_33606/g.88431  ORF Transcript_33606/g.88431 Transcript_33606/m.88431 type:complete len:83 (+) Transcript_33606:172-420(+)